MRLISLILQKKQRNISIFRRNMLIFEHILQKYCIFLEKTARNNRFGAIIVDAQPQKSPGNRGIMAKKEGFMAHFELFILEISQLLPEKRYFLVISLIFYRPLYIKLSSEMPKIGHFLDNLMANRAIIEQIRYISSILEHKQQYLCLKHT